MSNYEILVTIKVDNQQQSEMSARFDSAEGANKFISEITYEVDARADEVTGGC